MQVTI